MSEPGPKPKRCRQCGDKPVHWSNAAQDWVCLQCHLIAVKRGSHPPHVPAVAPPEGEVHITESELDECFGPRGTP